ncbi:MAG: hypothetical protein JWP79_3295 [Polaromonas sp.]|jgi:hypothetical protein|nr:hypothetical protein [Polaromonas sp.]MDB5845985.1 hypothetical protein [Polaromonas sp.]
MPRMPRMRRMEVMPTACAASWAGRTRYGKASNATVVFSANWIHIGEASGQSQERIW